MRKLQKIVALIVLTWLLTSFGMNAVIAGEWPFTHELTERKLKLIHKPFWLFGTDGANVLKNIQLKWGWDCVKWSSVTTLDDGNKIWSHIDENCNWTQSEYSDFPLDPNNFVDPIEFEEEWTDDFLGDLFNEDNFNSIDDNASGDSSSNLDDDSGVAEDDLGYVDDFLGDIFWKTIIEKLSWDTTNKELLTLRWKSLSNSLKAFSKKSSKMNISNIEVNVLEWEWYYNSKVAELLHKVDKDFKIDSIKNDFAKNISSVSYSLSTFISDDIDSEIQEVFRKKLIKDLKTLQNKYRVLKKKDMMISKTLEKRGAL